MPQGGRAFLLPKLRKRRRIVLGLVQQLHIAGQVVDCPPLVGLHLHSKPSLQPGNVPGYLLENNAQLPELFRADGAAVGVDHGDLAPLPQAGQKLMVQHGDALGLVVEIVGGALVRAQIIGLLTLCRGIGQLGLGEPDILPNLLRAHRLVEVFANQQRLAQLIKAKAAAGALYRVFVLTVALDNPPNPLGGDGFGVVHHLHQNEFAVPTVGLVHVEDSVGGGAGTGEAVEDDGVFFCGNLDDALN